MRTRRRRSAIEVRARCRHHNAYGVRCETRIPEDQKFCHRHPKKGKEAERMERHARAAEVEMRRRNEELAAYRARLDPGPLPL